MEDILLRHLPIDLGDIRLIDPDRLSHSLPDDHPLLQRMTPDGITQGERLERARADLGRLLDGWRPDPDTLAGAPILTDWRLAEQGEIVLLGRMHGHPHIAGGHRGATSMLIAVETNWFWARTVSRFYRLGVPQGWEARWGDG